MGMQVSVNGQMQLQVALRAPPPTVQRYILNFSHHILLLLAYRA